jgi:hypothetical protein
MIFLMNNFEFNNLMLFFIDAVLHFMNVEYKAKKDENKKIIEVE